jgi:hypothetical protein
LFNAAELPRIRATLTRPEFAVFWDAARRADLAADERFLRDEIKLNEPVRDLARAANILLRSAFVQVIEPAPAHAALANLALERMLAYRRWDWFLEAGRDTVGIMRNGSTSVAAVLAADWLGDDLNPALRARLDRYIAEETGPAAERAVFGMTHHDQVVGWSMDPEMTGYAKVDVSRWPAILDRNNLRIIATSGLAAAAAHLGPCDPRSARWAAQTADSLRLFASRLPADGSFPEGPDYWYFTFTYFIMSVELLHRHCGLDLRNVCDFPAMARYVQSVTLPTHGKPDGCLNIGDAFLTSGAEPLAWIGRTFRDSQANHLVLQPGCIRDTAVNAFGAIWFDASVPPRRSADLTTDRVLFPGIVLSRSGWETKDSVLSLRSGEPENHEHADRNSLLFAAHGERLLNDPLKAAYPRNDPKWLLRLTAAHTALLIDGRGHVYHEGEEGTNASTAAAHLVDHRLGPNWMWAASDATDAYRRAGLPVTLVRRSVLFLKPDVLIVADEVALTTALPVQTRWQVHHNDDQGAVAAEATAFTITRPHATLHALLAAAGDFIVRTDRLPLPADGGIYPYAEVVSASAPKHLLLTVCTACPAGKNHGPLALRHTAAGWQITGTHRGLNVDIGLDFSVAALPAVRL